MRFRPSIASLNTSIDSDVLSGAYSNSSPDRQNTSALQYQLDITYLARPNPFATTSMSALPDTVQAEYGQITPPDDHCKAEWNGGQVLSDLSADASTSSERRRSDESSSSGHPAPSAGRVDKKDKYREKNRVAAAKCRAKKKEHVDDLEESHRTQSMLNGLLKQTEQNLRDELSYWRTQALQHSYCDCQAIQDYNMRKARALAADKDFGAADMFRRDSMASPPSAVGTSNTTSFYPSQPDFEAQQTG